VRAHGGVLVSKPLRLWRIDTRSAIRIAPGLRARGLLRYAEPDLPRPEAALPSDPLSVPEIGWHLYHIGADRAEPPREGDQRARERDDEDHDEAREAQARRRVHVRLRRQRDTHRLREAERHAESGRTVILIGHAGHPEVVGTMGQLPPGRVLLVEDAAQIERLVVPDPSNLAYATQTTLSVDDTIAIVTALRQRFPAIQGPKMEDICYATTNRQGAVKAIAERCDALVVIGAPNSSNSMRLVEVAASYGCTKAKLVQRAADMDWAWLGDARRLGITAGASAPELLVDELIAACRERYDVTVEEVRTTEETVVFKLPRQLVA